MKYSISTLIIVFALFFFSCEKDNYDEPNSGIRGQFIDEDTKELVPMPVAKKDGPAALRINLYEKDRFYLPGNDPNYSREPLKTWAQTDGSYERNWIFSADYVMTFEQINFLPVDTLFVKLNRGKVTTQNIEITPYARVEILTAEIDQEIIKPGTAKEVTRRDLNVNFKIARSTNIPNEAHLNNAYLYWSTTPLIDHDGSNRVNVKSIVITNADLDRVLTITHDFVTDNEFKNAQKEVILNNNDLIYIRIGVQTDNKINYSKVLPVKLYLDEYK